MIEPLQFFKDFQDYANDRRLRELTYGNDSPTLSQDVGMSPDFTYAQRVDEASATVFYKGWALPGTASSAASWRLQRITLSATEADATIEWANGSTSFSNVWDDRASLTYT